MAQMEHSNDLAKVWIGEAAPQHRRPESMAGTGRKQFNPLIPTSPLRDCPVYHPECRTPTRRVTGPVRWTNSPSCLDRIVPFAGKLDQSSTVPPKPQVWSGEARS